MQDRDDHSEIFPGSIEYIAPAGTVRRRQMRSNGIVADMIELTRREPIEYRIRPRCHTLIVSEWQARDDGETVLEGLPKSRLREFSHKMSFVPSSHHFSGWQKPRVLNRVNYLYLDPKSRLLDTELRLSEIELKPRLFFFESNLWETAQKLKAAIGQANSSAYAEALALVLAHELIQLDTSALPSTPRQGGLAAWQQKKVAEYVDEHLNQDISLDVLAGIACLSPYHFAHVFKQTFGVPPHRYITGRRVTRAKDLLGNPARTVTEIGRLVGFVETSSFTAAFRRVTGITPTDYRRRLD
jgi:AraC family transcriptional regulator